jgi:hypothetical protein
MSDVLTPGERALATSALSETPLVTGPRWTEVYDEATGTMVRKPPQNHEALTKMTEFDLAARYCRISDGKIVVAGPSGKAGHAWNSGGLDMLTAPSEGPMVLEAIDNKAYASTAPIREVDALTNKSKLLKYFAQVRAEIADPTLNASPRIGEIRAAVDGVHKALSSGLPLPDNVRLVVRDQGGRSQGITPELQSLGVQYESTQIPATAVPTVAKEPAPSPVTPLRPVRSSPITVPPSPFSTAINGATELLGGMLHGMAREAWRQQDIVKPMNDEWEKTMARVDELRAKGRYVRVEAVMDAPLIPDLLSDHLGLAEPHNRVYFSHYHVIDGATASETFEPPKGDTISAAPAEGRSLVRIPYRAFFPVGLDDRGRPVELLPEMKAYLERGAGLPPR